MNSFNFQYKSFLIGILSGTVISGAASYVYVQNEFKKNTDNKILTLVKANKAEGDTKIEVDSKAKKAQPKAESEKNAMANTAAKTSNNEFAAKDSLIESTAIDTNFVTETISLSAETIKNDFEEIIVKKDEMIFSLFVEMQMLDSLQTKKLSTTDSLLAKNADIRESDKKSKYTVEYWLSPINYSGYKMANNKLVIFGFRDFDTTPELFSFEQKIYLKHHDFFYRLENTFEFKPIRKITDEDLIARLQKL